MKQFRTILPGAALVASVLILAFPAVAAGESHPLTLGTPMPSGDVAMQNVDGKSLTLAAAVGRHGTLVVFTCNHCPFAQAWEQRIAELGNDFVSRGIGVVAVNSNDPDRVPEDGFVQMKERAKKLGLQFPYVVDATSDVARAFGATRTPEAFLFDAEGELVYHGTIDDNYEHPDQVRERYLRDAVEQLLAGEPIATGETKAVGCSIKFRG